MSSERRSARSARTRSRRSASQVGAAVIASVGTASLRRSLGAGAASKAPPAGAAFAGSELLKPREPGPPAPVSEAWIQAAKRVAADRADAPAYLEAAWQGTDAWWLRPAAYAWAVGVGLGVRLVYPPSKRVSKAPQPAESTAAGSAAGELNASRAASVRAALTALELPFFATSAAWVDRPVSGLQVKGNFREGALDAVDKTMEVLQSKVEAELGCTVMLQILRSEDAPQNSTDTMSYELFISKVPEQSISMTEVMMSLMSLVVTAAAVVFLGASDASQAAGAILQPGSSMPLGLLAGILAAGQAARLLVARSCGSSITPPLLLPSPQLGVVAALSSNTPCSSRASSVSLALAGPLAMAAASALLLAYGVLVGSGSFIDLHTPLSIVWTLNLLPAHCDVLVWAGAHGLLMSGVALLPHSPDGQAVIQSLYGRSFGERVTEVFAYAYPILGLVSTWANGPGWSILPFWWAWLLINFASSSPALPKEEASEVPLATSALAHAALALALFSAYPWPLDILQ